MVVTNSFVKLAVDVEIQPFRAIIVPGPSFEYLEILFRSKNSENFNTLRVYNEQTYSHTESDGKLYAAYPFVEGKKTLMIVNFTNSSGHDATLKSDITFIRRLDMLVINILHASSWKALK